MSAIDHAGQRFGRLTVIKRGPDHFEPSGLRVVQWECACECGNVKLVRGRHLRLGRIQSCGCLRADSLRARARDLTGQKFGRLAVVRRSDERDPKGKWLWLCRCSCGNTTFVPSARLVTGHTRSCGCLHSEATGDANRARRKSVVTYRTAHERIRIERGRAAEYQCADCDAPAAQWSYDKTDPDELRQPNSNGWSGVTELVYSLDPYRYQPRCLSCHLKFDHSSKAKGAAS